MTRTAVDGAAAGQAQTHTGRSSEEGQKKDTHHTEAVLVSGESVNHERTQRAKIATSKAAAGRAQTHVRRSDEEGQKKDILTVLVLSWSRGSQGMSPAVQLGGDLCRRKFWRSTSSTTRWDEELRRMWSSTTREGCAVWILRKEV